MSDKPTILVVEDNDFVRMQICTFLHGAGFDTVEAVSGQQALDTISDAVDLALVDVRMEPVDGFEFIRRIRNNDMTVPVILVTGDENPTLLSEASRLGVAAVLKKPVQKERLIKMVSRTLSLETA